MNNIELAFTCGTPEQLRSVPRRPQIALSGRSNVGKSSMLNTLVGRKSIARVSGEPGKTITVNFYEIDHKFYLVDLPGYGYAKRSPDERSRIARLGEGYFDICEPALVVQLIDSVAGPTSDDMTMLEFLSQREIPFIVAATKIDKLNKTKRAQSLEAIPVEEDFVIPFSSRTGEGRSALCTRLLSAIR